MSSSPSRRRFLRQAVTGAALAPTVALTACGGGGDDLPGVGFAHGVASGDPLSDRLVIWTRATPDRDAEIEIAWEVATDDAFRQVVRQGTVWTDTSRDYTVKVNVTGLQANTRYWYRFRHDRDHSPVGRTRTLPTGSVEQVRLAVFSCSSYPSGYFHVYADAAKRDDIDVAIHLGDYIYEYGRGGYGSAQAATMGREVEPATETIYLADYRRRYAQYRTDPDLQALHAAVPMIAVWDDHEIANDTWTDGAENHQPDTEGDFALRKAAAVRAYHEWLPIREQDPLNVIYRGFDFGDLLSLHMLDTRVLARSEQLSYDRYLPALLGNPDPAAGLQQFVSRFAADAGNPERHLLGGGQFDWLKARMTNSSATWQVLGQQVLMAPVQLPMPVLLGLLQAAGELGDAVLPPALLTDPLSYITLAQRAAAGDPTLTASDQALLAMPCIPYNLDSWDGYWAEREALLSTIRAMDKNLVVLAGDTHNAWASELRDAQGRAVGVELATASVTSPGLEAYLGAGFPPEQLAMAATALANLNTPAAGRNWAGSLRYTDTSRRGYMVVNVTRSAIDTEWVFVSDVFQAGYTATTGMRARTLPGAAQRGRLELG